MSPSRPANPVEIIVNEFGISPLPLIARIAHTFLVSIALFHLLNLNINLQTLINFSLTEALPQRWFRSATAVGQQHGPF
jgi:hypothetical protein